MQLCNLVVALSVFAVAACRSSSDHHATSAGSSDDAMAGMPEMARVTQHHRALERKAGQWTARVKDPTGHESAGTYEASVGCGGLWLIGDYHGDFAGMSFSGHEVMGYDAQKAKYVTTWVDSMMDHPTTLEGTFDEASGTLTQWTQGHDPATGKSIKERHETRFVGNDQMIYTMSGPDGDGVYTPFMTITYTRKK